MKSQIKIFETGIDVGIMSSNEKFYLQNTSLEQRKKAFKNVRIEAGKKYNFDGLKMFQALQKNEKNGLNYKDGKYIVLSDENMKKTDYWEENLPADILIITNKYPKIVVGNQMADCPILIAEDRKLGVTALSHCGGSYINRNLPYQTIESLIKEFNSKPENIYVYIGSCVTKDNYIYDKYPTWATNKKIWEDCIEEKAGYFYIDMIKAICNQLTKLNIDNIKVSEIDTVISEKYYSHIAEVNGNLTKKGQNFVGFYYL